MIALREPLRPMGRDRRAIGVWPLIVWAFKREAAQLDFDDDRAELSQGFGYASATAIIAQHEMLGCRIDGGGRSDPHPDADIVASALAVLPEGCGGRRMAITMVEHARADTMPGWHVATSIQPVRWDRNPHGRYAMTADAVADGVAVPAMVSGWRGRLQRQEGRYCPVVVMGGPSEVAARRRDYLRWWSALLDVRTSLQLGNDLSAWVVTDDMPPMQPWERG
ncbi:hypothetical protein AN189_18035 [Loktanella sp. 3ANDIMAR09]|uniref:hypothetical protein n=1 Tax=Loktanella sp. 3ANDIMAR09 TaxID=1225657 RepID=UPI0006F26BD6|nr:hypothetical protein [Loktanella sp. 3ANDIMAR09]KQI66955.1 hypothetical protein AN189_18035 [Loktanella sp. 3ANDIMAR09]